jgi:plastocyanin
MNMTDDLRPAHARTQTIGLILIASAFLFLVLLTFALFGGEDVAIFVVLTAIVAGVAYLTHRFDTQWARSLGLVGTILSLMFFFLGFGLFQIFSPIEFTVAVAYVLGIALSLVGGIRAILASRKDKAGPTSAEARLPRVVIGIVGVAAVVSVFGFIFTRQVVSDSEAEGATVIEMKNFEFNPENATTPSGSRVLLSNTDPFVHDFTVEDLDIDVTVGPKGEALVDLADVAPGTYEYFCSLHYDGTSGMHGTLIVGG